MRRIAPARILLVTGSILVAAGIASILPVFLGRFELAEWAPAGAIFFTLGLICIITAIVMGFWTKRGFV
jgi:hypothetical protein